jgi:ribosomal protein S27AE
MLAARAGEYLVAACEQERQGHWERHHAERWACPCGETFGLYALSERRVAFYTLADDGSFLEQATDRPTCGRDLAAAREDGFAL